jgi:hypothetical protein
MKARKLIGDAAFGPERLKVIGQAFDDAWEAIAGNFANDAQTVETARLKLATIMLELAKNADLGGEQLKLAAIRRLREQYAAASESS